jgi:hypothetical protein
MRRCPIGVRISASGLRPIGFDITISVPPRAPPLNPPGLCPGPAKGKAFGILYFSSIDRRRLERLRVSKELAPRRNKPKGATYWIRIEANFHQVGRPEAGAELWWDLQGRSPWTCASALILAPLARGAMVRNMAPFSR